jgi:hypothetical protein
LPSTITQTTIANRALQLLGYKAINSLSDNDRGARAINRAYYSRRDALLMSNFWLFSIKRVQLVASATAPTFGPSAAYPLPADFLILAPSDPTYSGSPYGPAGQEPQTHDWQIEGNAIVSNEASPLNVRYVSNDVTESMFDACFAEAFAADLARNICEELTQSNSKIQTCNAAFDEAMQLAKQRNAYESRPVKAPLSSWITARF